MTTWTATQPNAHLEREIITGMIVSDRALRIIGLAYKPQYLTSDFGREVARWCLIHQEKYNCAPRSDIQTHFEAARRNGLATEIAQLVAQLLSSLSQEFERTNQFNEQLCIDTAAAYFRERALTILKEDLEYHLDGGNVNAAHAAVAEFSAPSNSISLGCEPLTDMDGIREAFENRNTLFRLPGDLGRMIGPLEREWTVMVVGKYKGAKSFTCQHIAFQALFSGLHVAWFDLELGEYRLKRRFAQGICAMPLKPPKYGKLLKPVWDCQDNQQGTCQHYARTNLVQLITDNERPDFHKAPQGYMPCRACDNARLDTWFTEVNLDILDWRTAWHKAQAVIGSVMGARMKVQSWPKFSAGVDDVKATLHVWRNLEDFSPDVIIIDQPDIMKMSGHGDVRHKIDELWKSLGAIPQELHCLLVVPSQAGGKDAQERKRLRVSDVAEESRKLGHVDMSIKIDQSELDKAAQRAIYSLGVGRDDEASSESVMALQCLGLGQAVIDSRNIT